MPEAEGDTEQGPDPRPISDPEPGPAADSEVNTPSAPWRRTEEFDARVAENWVGLKF